MNNENLQKWALIAEILSAVAVVFSLLFVGLEIRSSSEETVRNTKAIELQVDLARAAALTDPVIDNINGFSEIQFKAFNSIGFPGAELAAKFVQDYGLNSVEEGHRLANWAYRTLLNIQAYYLYSGETEQLQRQVINVMQAPAFPEVFIANARTWDTEFSEFVETYLPESLQ